MANVLCLGASSRWALEGGCDGDDYCRHCQASLQAFIPLDTRMPLYCSRIAAAETSGRPDIQAARLFQCARF
jgi:hypothetical protein